MINKAFKLLFDEPVEVAKKLNIDLNLRPNQITEKEYFKIAQYLEEKN